MIKWIILAIVVLIMVSFVSIINRIKYLKNRVARGKSVVDVFLKKRFDLIPNLVETVKGYATYEKSTLEEITKLRTEFQNTQSEEAANKLNGYYKDTLAVIERYPDLKASQNFLHLQKTLVKVENEISAARRIYINDITRYNTKIETFPGNVIAEMLSYYKEEMPQYEIEDIKIDF